MKYNLLTFKNRIHVDPYNSHGILWGRGTRTERRVTSRLWDWMCHTTCRHSFLLASFRTHRKASRVWKVFPSYISLQEPKTSTKHLLRMLHLPPKLPSFFSGRSTAGLRKLRSPSLPACPSSPCPPVQPILLRTGRAPGDGGRHVRHARSPAVFGCQSNVSIKKGTCGTWKIEKSDIKRLQVCLFFPSPVYLCTRLPFSISEKEVGWL